MARRKKGSSYTPPAKQRHWYPRKQADKRAKAARKAALPDESGQPARAGQPRGRTPAAGRPVPRPTASTGRASTRPPSRPGPVPPDAEIVAGRNPVVEALRVGVPAEVLYLARGGDADARVREAVRLAGDTGVAVLQSSRGELDRLTAGSAHQGLALQVPGYAYAHPDDLIARARDAGRTPLLVALDGVTDPRNLGAVARSAAAFGCHGIVVPQRRTAGVTAAAWKASAGALARVPVARATNLTRTLRGCQESGLFVVGLAASAPSAIDDLEVTTEPLVMAVGSEGRGLSRLVTEACDTTARIPMADDAESLNAGVAAGIALYEVARARRPS